MKIRAAVLEGFGKPLVVQEVDLAGPRKGEALVKVHACGVCHTELDEIEGRTPPPAFPIIPGHEAVGRVARRGAGCSRHTVGDRVGVGWIHSSDGSAHENISAAFQATMKLAPDPPRMSVFLTRNSVVSSGPS